VAAEDRIVPESLRLHEIKVHVTGFFTTHHYFDTPAGNWGEFTFPSFSDQGTFRRGVGRELVMRKVHWLGTAHEMLDGSAVRSSADRPGFLSRDLIIDFDAQQYRLQPEGTLKDGWFLTDAADTRLLELRPRGIFREGAYLTITGPLEEDLVAFAYYLVHTRGQEEAAAAAATTAASAS